MLFYFCIVLITLICSPVQTARPIGPLGAVKLFYDYQRDVIIFGVTMRFYSLNVSTGSIVSIANITSANIVFGIAPLIVNGVIIRYLVVDGWRNCIDSIDAEYPHNVSTMFGNCSDTSTYALLRYASGIATGTNGYAVSTRVNSTILAFNLDTSNMTLVRTFDTPWLLQSGPFLPEARTIRFVKNLIVNGTSLSSPNWDILLISDSLGHYSASYNRSLISLGSIPVDGISLNERPLKQYGPIIFLGTCTQYMNSTRFGYGVGNLSLNCSDMLGHLEDVVLLPNGTLIQTRAGDTMYVLNCSMPSYNRNELVINVRGLTKTRSRSRSRTRIIPMTTSTNATTDSNTTAIVNTTMNITTDSMTSTTATTDVNTTMNVTTNPGTSAGTSTTVVTSSTTGITQTSTGTSITTRISSTISSTTSSTIGASTTIPTSSTLAGITTIPTSSTSMGTTISSTTVTTHHIRTRTHSPQQRTYIIPLATSTNLLSETTKTATVTLSTLSISASIGSGGARTSAFLAIVSGNCDNVRELEWYENPFGTKLVFLGNVGFICIVSSVLMLIGITSETIRVYYGSGTRPDVITIAVKYKIIDISYMLWSFLLPPIIVSFVKYHNEWYDFGSIVLGVFFILISLIFLVAGTLDIVGTKIEYTTGEGSEECRRYGRDWIHWLLEEDIKWSEGLRVIHPIIQGYTSRTGILVDIATMLIVSCSTLIENCSYLGIVTVTIDLLYCAYLMTNGGFRLHPLQPRCLMLSNLSFTIGQIVGIFLALFGLYEQSGVTIVSVSSAIGFVMLLLPVIKWVIERFTTCSKEDHRIPEIKSINVLLELEMAMQSSQNEHELLRL